MLYLAYQAQTDLIGPGAQMASWRIATLGLRDLDNGWFAASGTSLRPTN